MLGHDGQVAEGVIIWLSVRTNNNPGDIGGLQASNAFHKLLEILEVVPRSLKFSV